MIAFPAATRHSVSPRGRSCSISGTRRSTPLQQSWRSHLRQWRPRVGRRARSSRFLTRTSVPLAPLPLAAPDHHACLTSSRPLRERLGVLRIAQLRRVEGQLGVHGPVRHDDEAVIRCHFCIYERDLSELWQRLQLPNHATRARRRLQEHPHRHLHPSRAPCCGACGALLVGTEMARQDGSPGELPPLPP